jgi:hypothetical protein
MIEETNIVRRREAMEGFAKTCTDKVFSYLEKDFNVLASKYYALMCLKTCITSLAEWKTKALHLIAHCQKAHGTDSKVKTVIK